MYKKPDIVYFEDEKLTKQITTVKFPDNVEPEETVRRTVWLYNMGNAVLSKIKVSVTPTNNEVQIKCAPPELKPMEKGLVILEWTPKKETKLSVTLNVDGGHAR